MPNMRNALRTLKGTPSRLQTGTRAMGVLAVLALTSVGLVACGGSSGTTASQTAAAATSAASGAASGEKGGTSGTSTLKGAGPGGATGPNSPRKRFSAVRECLQKNGVKLPAPAAGSGRPGSGVLGALAGGRLPSGVTRAQLQAAFAKCGRGAFPGAAGGPGNFRRANSPVFRKALATYAGCLRQNGVNVPAPNASGKGPVFSTKGLNTSSPQFKAATMKCRGVLLSGFRGAHR